MRVYLRVGGLFVCWLLNVPATCECISGWEDCLFVGCLTSQQHASVSQGGRIVCMLAA